MRTPGYYPLKVEATVTAPSLRTALCGVQSGALYFTMRFLLGTTLRGRRGAVQGHTAGHSQNGARTPVSGFLDLSRV